MQTSTNLDEDEGPGYVPPASTANVGTVFDQKTGDVTKRIRKHPKRSRQGLTCLHVRRRSHLT